jgi:hypothetical protein
METIYGAIGYTLLKNDKETPNYILIFSDDHSKLKKCNNYQKISEWFKLKSKHTNILLEEVPKEHRLKVQNIFIDSEHTNDLMNLYLNNSNIIHPVDIRHSLLPFSWILMMIVKPEMKKITFKVYIKEIINFYILENNKIKKMLGEVYTEEYLDSSLLGKHFNLIKNIFINYIEKNLNYMDKMMIDIYNNNKDLLVKLEEHTDHIMEFYIMCKIYLLKNNKKNIIVHTGLFHSFKLVHLLDKLYNYDIIDQQGINDLKNLNDDIAEGCLKLSKEIKDNF